MIVDGLLPHTYNRSGSRLHGPYFVLQSWTAAVTILFGKLECGVGCVGGDSPGAQAPFGHHHSMHAPNPT